MAEWLGLALLALVVAGGASVLVYAIALGAGPVPTSTKVRRAMLSLLPKEVRGEVHEPGCGFGGLAFALADALPEATIVATERSPVPWAFCRLRQALRPRKNLRVVRGDLFATDYTRAAGVVCFLHTGAMARLGPQLAERLPAGAFVVSNTFAFRGWTAEATTTVEDLYRTRVYRYVR